MSYEDLGKIRIRSPIGIKFKGGFKITARSPVIQVQSKATIQDQQKACENTPVTPMDPRILVEAYLRRYPNSNPAQAEAESRKLVAAKYGVGKDCGMGPRSEGFLGIRLAAKGSKIDRCCELGERRRYAAAEQAVLSELTSGADLDAARARGAAAAGSAAMAAAAKASASASRAASIRAAAERARTSSASMAARSAGAARAMEAAAKAAAAASQQASVRAAEKTGIPWLWIGIGVAAVGVSAYVLTRR